MAIEETTEEELITEEALRNAQKGQFQNTMLEMWYRTIENLIGSSRGPITIELASMILRSYAWLDHSDIRTYMDDRADKFEEALAIMDAVLGDKKEKIFSENVDDWKLHADIYIEVMTKWNHMANHWAELWPETVDKVTHASIIDVGGMLLNSEYGMIEGIKNLADFEITDEQRKILNAPAGDDDE